MLADSAKKVKEWCGENRSDLVIAGIIFFTSLSSFGLGRLSIHIKPNPSISIINTPPNAIENRDGSAVASTDQMIVVASRNGTVYYHSWCSGAQRIKEENKIRFPSKEAAQKAGLKSAANCSDIK